MKRCINCEHCISLFTIRSKTGKVKIDYACIAIRAFIIKKPYSLNRCKHFKRNEKEVEVDEKSRD